jgi:hypothetical protein
MLPGNPGHLIHRFLYSQFPWTFDMLASRSLAVLKSEFQQTLETGNQGYLADLVY